MANSKCWSGNWSHMTIWKSSFACLIWTRRKSDLSVVSPHSSYHLVLSHPSQAILLSESHQPYSPSSLYSSPHSYNLAASPQFLWICSSHVERWLKLLPWTPPCPLPAWPLQHLTAWWLFPWNSHLPWLPQHHSLLAFFWLISQLPLHFPLVCYLGVSTLPVVSQILFSWTLWSQKYSPVQSLNTTIFVGMAPPSSHPLWPLS